MSFRALRSLSAWALPRPSAIASARLAKTTVNHSQMDTASAKPALVSTCPVKTAWAQSSVVKKLPTSTTNITGFLTMRRGSSFLNASTMAPATMARSKSGRGAGSSDRAVMMHLPSVAGVR